jgi:hypothetical protein
MHPQLHPQQQQQRQQQECHPEAPASVPCRTQAAVLPQLLLGDVLQQQAQRVAAAAATQHQVLQGELARHLAMPLRHKTLGLLLQTLAILQHQQARN